MTARHGWATAVVLFGSSTVLAFADAWLLAVAALIPVGWLAGRFNRGQRIAELTAERDQARGEVFALSEERRFVWNRHLASRFADDDPPMPGNGAGHYSTADLNDRNSTARDAAAPVSRTSTTTA